MEKIKGTGVALVTPFNADKSIDYKGLESLLTHVIDGGVDYLVLMGTTGESATLSKEEKIEVVNFCKEINKERLPIVLGIGGNNTMQIVSDLQSTNLDGIDAILSVSPCYNKPSQEGIYQHYKMISKNSPLPIIMYNVPGRTASNISAETTLRLASEFENIVAIKEASGDMDQIMKIIQGKPSRFIVLSGDDGLTLPMIYMGAEGVISVIGQTHPKEYSDMVSFGISANNVIAGELHKRLYAFYQPLYEEGNPVGVKACLQVLGICKSEVRLPLVKASEKITQDLKKLIEQ
ncbi:MAG: 4-hydroxy-tetrahydrodipicolinate synthase [Flavobacteriales bacterium]|nr:4-hydroxy-tetrahydrodipicolinate synthase [Flavobacteriales bacterium]|tara:strand:- start:8295 stop:9167 length:873 start_codon:yes stop_codon:yes gene_type:complete